MGANVPKPNRPDRIAAAQKLVSGLNKYATVLTLLVIGGTSMTVKQVIAAVQAIIAAATNVVATKAAWQAAVIADHEKDSDAFLASLRQAILAAFTGQVDVLADFGLTPRKKAVRTPADKQAAAAKAKATRIARHTMGKNQKAKVTGETPQGETTSTTAPTPAPAPTPVVTPAVVLATTPSTNAAIAPATAPASATVVPSAPAATPAPAVVAQVVSAPAPEPAPSEPKQA